MTSMQFELGDRLRLRKPHPCGNYDWVVVRLGADIGLSCEKCGRRVLLPRSEVERRTKQRLPRLTNPDDDLPT
ncbi:MAG: DUF951 domain-containing protein [Chloroflexi bacterium]|jgi:hypothetical protein|nr:MAG: DUF951 domain-containing protein [Chloroflexota bacterium]